MRDTGRLRSFGHQQEVCVGDQNARDGEYDKDDHE